MAVHVSYPGVYIEEFAPAPPIQGVGTSTAAFLGPASGGPIKQPVPISHWSDFLNTFGNQPMAGFYLWYAVRGFFENGGQNCYVVRISNASSSSFTFQDRGNANALVFQAVAPGSAGDSIHVQFADAHALAATTFQLSALIDVVDAASHTEITLHSADDAIQFRPGDVVVVDEQNAPRTRVSVVSITGHVLRVSDSLPATTGNHLRLADISNPAGDQVLRVTIDATQYNPANLATGTIIKISYNGTPAYGRADTVTTERMILSDGSTVITYRIRFAQPLPSFALTTAKPATLESEEFDLTVSQASTQEIFRFLSMDPVHPNYFGSVNIASNLVRVSPAVPPSTSALPNNLPKAVVSPGQSLQGGQDEVLSGLLPSDYKDGLDALVNVRDVNMVAIPDRSDSAVQGYLLDHCQGVPPAAGTRFAILDPRIGLAPSGAGSIVTQRNSLDSAGGFGALYYPWLLVPPAAPPPGTPPPKAPPPPVLVPPSGHVAGIYARTDDGRGVHKAPAGQDAVVKGAIGVETVLGDMDQGLLNLTYGINVIRVFKTGARPVVWGARTTATGVNSNWQYVNIRRLFLFLEGSITEGIRFAVFEPNDRGLWERLKLSISAFLTKVWHDGALFGSTGAEAFYVRIDDALNPPSELALGRLTIEIGVRPAYPAEFIVVRIGIWQGGSQASEQ